MLYTKLSANRYNLFGDSSFGAVTANMCMARSLRSLRQVATLRHGHMALRFAPAFRALGVYEHS